MIKLILTQGLYVYMNVDHIVAISQRDTLTSVWTVSECFGVKETVEDIMDKIAKEKKDE